VTSKRKTALLKVATFAACLAPVANLTFDAFTGGLGANPIEAGMNRLGWWTLFFLAAALVPTPLNDLLGWKWPVRLRRMLGLFAFAYATMHFGWYVGLDKFFDVHDIAGDVAKRRFQAVGFAAYLTLWPLAVTSTAAAVRRMGYVRWKRLHRLAYVAAVLGVVHFVWRVKADLREPAIFGLAIGALLLVRVAVWGARRRAQARQGLAVP
jgi:sulfoxide reductase heme-binding subunit YedZ